MVAKVKRDLPVAAQKKVAKTNGIAKPSKRPKHAARKSAAGIKESAEPAKNIPAGKHIVFDDDDKPIAAAKAKKIQKKASKENVNDIGKRWYEEVTNDSKIVWK